MRILFIEDNPEFAKYVVELLSDFDHEVNIVDNADDAVNLLSEIERKYDLVILDIMMRLGSIIKENEASDTGIAIYKRLRSKNKNIRVLVLSALAKKDIWSAFSQDNKARYFGKPLRKDTSDFLELIREF